MSPPYDVHEPICRGGGWWWTQVGVTRSKDLPAPKAKPGSADTALSTQPPPGTEVPFYARQLGSPGSAPPSMQCTPSRGPAPEQSRAQGRGHGTPGVGPRPVSALTQRGFPGPASAGRLGFPLLETKGGPGRPCARLVGAGPAGGHGERVPGGVGVESSLSPQEICPPRPRKPARHNGCHTSGTSDARTSVALRQGRHCTGPGPVVPGCSLSGRPS